MCRYAEDEDGELDVEYVEVKRSDDPLRRQPDDRGTF